jgi:membrane protein implicated in regulation of membrane protease activity
MKIPVFVIIAVGALIVGACLIASVIVAMCYPASAAILPNYLQAAFTGFALVGLLATLWHERENTDEGRRQHTELLAAMSRQSEASTMQYKVQALVARVAGYDEQISRARQSNIGMQERDDLVKKLTKERTELLKRLDVLMT